MSSRLLTSQEAATFLSIHVSTLQKLCRDGAIGYVKIDERSYRFRPEDLEDFIQRHYVPATFSNIPPEKQSQPKQTATEPSPHQSNKPVEQTADASSVPKKSKDARSSQVTKKPQSKGLDDFVQAMNKILDDRPDTRSSESVIMKAK